MLCPWFRTVTGEPKCVRSCPFYHKVDETMEECLLANSIVAIPSELKGIYNMLEELTEETIAVHANMVDILTRLEVSADESDRQEHREIRRVGEEADEGTREDAQERRNDREREGAEDSGIRRKGAAEEGDQEGDAGQGSEEEPPAPEVLEE